MLRRAEVDRTGFDQEAGSRTRRAWTPLSRALAAAGDHWTLLIAVTLAPGKLRVSELQGRLPGLSAGVLERHVQHMAALGLVTRTRFKEMPPRVELELTDAGRELLPVAGALARWGVRHLWSAPRDREQVDLGALLNLLPLLLEEAPDLPGGSIELIVEGADPPLRRRYAVEKGRLRGDDRLPGTAPALDRQAPAPGKYAPALGKQPPTAGQRPTRLRGDTDAWIAVLGPAADRTRLRVTGDRRLAKRILEALAG